MSNITHPIAETWLCTDCTTAHEGGESYPEHSEPISDITSDWDSNESEDSGHWGFSRTPCGVCGTVLAGDRYRYAVWAW